MTFDELLASEPSIRKRPTDEEHRLQCDCVTWFNLMFPLLRGLLFAVPNGGRRDAVTGKRLKAEGVIAGVSDLILLKQNKDFGALLIEMKTATGKQSDAQREWRDKVTMQGYKYTVCRSLDEFIKTIVDYLSDL